jgi:hypothetical protein
MITTTIADGASLGPGHCAMIFQPSDDELTETEFDSLFSRWSEIEGAAIAPLEFVARRLVQFDDGIFVLGRLGHVTQFKDTMRINETIQGPEDFGFLTDLTAIGGRLYATGMSRQVYVRHAANDWKRFDRGVLDDSIQVERVTGFRSIDGLGEDGIYAVGLEGEIWHCRAGVWRQSVSPTNVTLEQVKVVGPDEVYAAGQAGVILRGSEDAWDVIEQTQTEEDFWGLEWFNDVLYVATASQLFKWSPGSDLEPLVLPGTELNILCRLRTGHGTLWVFGLHQVFWTENGAVWHEARLHLRESTS